MAPFEASQKAFSFDFSKLLVSENTFRELERDPEFYRGSFDELDRTFAAAIYEQKSQDLSQDEDGAIEFSILGILSTTQSIYLAGNLEKISHDRSKFIYEFIELFILFLEYFGLDWKLGGFINVELYELQIYSERKNKLENAPSFLKRVYATELAAESLTLSDLKERDPSLWRGLHNWAHAGEHNLYALIPRGQEKRGRPRAQLGFDSAILDPNNPRDAMTLRALRNREQTRERVKRHRQRQLKAEL